MCVIPRGTINNDCKSEAHIQTFNLIVIGNTIYKKGWACGQFSQVDSAIDSVTYYLLEV